jgi:CheY-like chemotaxis protein
MPRLLLVEDEPDMAFIAERLARRLGLDVAHRRDVASAWDCVCQAAPDLILLDLNLPDEHGELLCRWVRADAATARLPIALFVHWACTDDLLRGLEAGADFVAAKDLIGRPAAWLDRLREILARDGLRDAARVNCSGYDLLPPPSPEGLTALNRALRHPLLRQLGPDVVRFILRRALPRAGGGRWLETDGLALDAAHVAASGSGSDVMAFAAAVTEQLNRLLGPEATAPMREALAAAVDGLDG